jgi:hypothetical protein
LRRRGYVDARDYLVKGLAMEEGVALASAPTVTSQWYKDLLRLQAAGEDSADYDAFDKALLEGDLLQYVEKFEGAKLGGMSGTKLGST